MDRELRRFVILVREFEDGLDDGEFWYFPCQAEDTEHAKGQALDHRPGHMEVVSTYKHAK